MLDVTESSTSERKDWRGRRLPKAGGDTAFLRGHDQLTQEAEPGESARAEGSSAELGYDGPRVLR